MITGTGEAAAVPRWWPWLAMTAITACAAGLRFWSLSFGLPHTYARPDEDAIVAVASNIYLRGPNPLGFVYPTLYL